MSGMKDYDESDYERDEARGLEREDRWYAEQGAAEDDRQQADDWQLTLAVRDAIAIGLKVRAGTELTPAVIQERAANMAIALREQFEMRRRRG